MEGNMQEMEGNMQEMEGNMQEMEVNMQEMEGNMQDMEGNMKEMEDNRHEMEGKQENNNKLILLQANRRGKKKAANFHKNGQNEVDWCKCFLEQLFTPFNLNL